MMEGETGDDEYLQFALCSDESRSLQIRGFNHSHKGIEDIISLGNLVFLIVNKL